MKQWNAFIQDIKDKVGISPKGSQPGPSDWAAAARASEISALAIKYESSLGPVQWERQELESDFKRCWDHFLYSKSEKEKEIALSMTVEIFCILVKEQASVPHLIASLVEAHAFSFSIGKSIVLDIKKFRMSHSENSLHAGNVMCFLSGISKDGIRCGSSFLFALDVLVLAPIDKKPLLDSGIISCLVHILNAFLNPDDRGQRQSSLSFEDIACSEKTCNEDSTPPRYVEVEERIVHIMKMLAALPSAAVKLIEDDSLKILFEIVARGSLVVFSQFNQGLLSLRTVHLHQHAMQILNLLLLNNDGSIAKYIQKHHLIKVLLMAVKGFRLEDGDSAYTVGIVELILECVELSCRPGSGSVRLKEDMHNANGYQFLVEFALTLSCSQKNKVSPLIQPVSSKENSSINGPSPDDHVILKDATKNGVEKSPVPLYPSISRLLDILTNLAHTGLGGNVGSYDVKQFQTLEKGNTKVQDLEAIQMLQDIILKSENFQVQSDVLDILFKIFSSHVENYQLCQGLRTVPLLILSMVNFPQSLQETILKILDFVVAVVNCIPEQELLSLSCLLQQPISSYLQQAILSFFVKLLSFDSQYKKVLREIGVLDVLIDDLKQHRFNSGSGNQTENSSEAKDKSNSNSFKKDLDNEDVMLSSPRLLESCPERLSLFEDENSIAIAWDCLLSLLKNDEANQALFRSSNGLFIVLPFLVLDIHRSGALRLLSCLITEDTKQVHPEELGMLIETLKSGMVVNLMELEYKLMAEAICDVLGTLWRILGANSSAQRVFGEATGFSLLLTTFYSFQIIGDLQDDQVSLVEHMKIFSSLMRVMTAAVLGNSMNRVRLHTIITSQTFFDFLNEASLICVDWEKQVIQLLLELALEIIVSPFSGQAGSALPSSVQDPHFSFILNGSSSTTKTERVYNAGAVVVLFRSLVHLTPEVQLELLNFIGKLASASPFNQESLTSAGCVGLLLDAINPSLTRSTPLLMHALRIVEILGAYRLSTLELRVLVRYTLEMKSLNSGYYLVDMMEKLIQRQDALSENVSMAPFLEMDLRRTGHASIQASLGERTWPPIAGYSFVCWFKYTDLSNLQQGQQSFDGSLTSQSCGTHTGEHVLRIFSVGAVDDIKNSYVELSLHETRTLTLTTNNSSLSCSDFELEEGSWHHLAVIHSKPNALTGLFQASVAYLYLDGKLRCSGNLGYSPSPVGKALQVIIGASPAHANISNFSWSLRSCYLFEEVVTAHNACFMYILGRGYRGIFQDRDLLKFVPLQACGGDRISILDSLDVESTSVAKLGNINGNKIIDDRPYGSSFIWDFDMLVNLFSELAGKKLIFAFDGTSSEVQKASGRLCMLNLVDPKSAAASPFGGIPRFGLLNGDSYLCNQYVIGNCFRAVGGITVILSLVEAAKTRDMLHMALALLACALHQNPQNVLDMRACRGYHLLAIFLHRKMHVFDMQSLDIFFQMATCEASFMDSEKILKDQITPSETPEEDSKKVLRQNPKCIVASNADMIEHVLLDWTLWVTAPISIQIALVGFLEQLVSLHWYRNHNLACLRQIHLVQHLLVTLQRDDVEIQVLERIVILLSVILEDGFLASELDLVVRFVIMTFDPPETRTHLQITREMMGKHVVIRNLLLEMLIDLQLTITSEELLEKWYDILSIKFVMYFLDGYVHPTSMTWIMTLLGVCLAASPVFDDEFRQSGGYQVLTYVLPNYANSPDIYHIIFSLVFGKSVYPRKPDVCIEDFHDLMPSDGNYGELKSLKFVELLDSVISMAKSAFDKLSIKSVLAEHDNLSQLGDASNPVTYDYGEDFQAVNQRSSMYRLLSIGEAAAPATATSIIRFMVDLSKMCPSFCAICRRTRFLEYCVDLYFSCVWAHRALQMAENFKAHEQEECLQGTVQSQIDEQEPFDKVQEESSLTETSEGIHNLMDEHSKDKHGLQDSHDKHSSIILGSESSVDMEKTVEGGTGPNMETSKQASFVSYTSNSDLSKFNSSSKNSDRHLEPSSTLLYTSSLAASTKKSSSAGALAPSPVLALASWLGSKGIRSGMKVQPTSRPLVEFPHSETSTPPDPWGGLQKQQSSTKDTPLSIDSNLLVEIDALADIGCSTAAGATATLDFIAVVLSDIVAEQPKASQVVESILESVPLHVVVEAVLAFQGLCLSRMMTFLERRLLRDDEEGEKKLDKSIWSVNLAALCWMIVDRVYMGAFPQPISVSKTLDFVLSMLQLANKGGCIEKAIPSGRGLLARTTGVKQLESHIRALLKCANRLIMYCFLPLFLISIGEDDFLACLGFQNESRKSILMKTLQDESDMGLVGILRSLYGHKHLVLCPSNLDTDLICCLCVNLIYLLRDRRQIVRNLAVDIMKYLLIHRQAALEELLAANPYQGLSLNVLDGGFDKLLNGSLSSFFEWFHSSEQIINIALDQCAALMWTQYIGGSAKFPGIRIKGMEVRRQREIGKKLNEVYESDFKHWEHTNEQRKALMLVRNAVSTELKMLRQNKYGWILHAESEWTNHLQQLVHERGIIPLHSSSSDTEWQLCPIEGPYRMRKKLSRCKFKVGRVQSFLGSASVLEGRKPAEETDKNAFITSSNLDSDSNYLLDGVKLRDIDGGDYQDGNIETDEFGHEDSMSARSLNDQVSSVGEASLRSLHSKSDGSSHQRLVTASPSPSQFSLKDERKPLDDGEYLIRPYLEHQEKIRIKYNCERVVGLDKHDGIFLIGERCLYIIENFYIDEHGCIHEKQAEGQLSVIDQALGVMGDVTGGSDSLRRSPSAIAAASMALLGGRAWAYDAGGWDKEKATSNGNLPHPWRMWKHERIHELLKRDYQLRPAAIEIFSIDGCNDLLVFHKQEREEVFNNLVTLNLPVYNLLVSTISGLSIQETNDSNQLTRMSAKSFCKRWQNGEISNFQYLMHLNTLAGRGYNDLTQYPVFPWVLADYESETLDLANPETFRKFDKPVGCQTTEGEEEFKSRYEAWDDPDVPKFHFGSHYSSAGIVLFYLLRLPPFTTENQKLQGGQYDRADRLFTSIRDTWLSACAKENTSDVKELIPEFFYLPEFLENRFNLDLGVKQSGEKVGDVILPLWARGSTREFIRKNREALECNYVSENLHHWIDLIFGYKQRGKAAVEAVNVFYHYTYEGSVDIDSISDPTMKASILAQINHFGQTPKQLFLKPHPKRQTDMKTPLHPLRHCSDLMPHEVRKSSSSITQIVFFHEKILVAGKNSLLKPSSYNKCIVWGFPDCSLRFMTCDQEKVLSTHENLHGGSQIRCAAVDSDGQILVTGGDDGVVSIWQIDKEKSRGRKNLHLQRTLCSHIAKITCLYVSQTYKLIVSGSEDCSVILWDLSTLDFVRQLAEFAEPVSAVCVNDFSGDIITAAGILLSVWSVNGDCLAVLNTSQLPSDTILSITTSTFSDWQDTDWYATGHQSGSIKVWNMIHCTNYLRSMNNNADTETSGFNYDGKLPEYRLVLKRVLKSHDHPVTAVHLTSDLKQLLSGNSAGNLLSWTLPGENVKASPRPRMTM